MLESVSLHVHSDDRQSVNNFGCRIRWVHSFLSLAFATRSNQKHSSYVTTWLFFKFRLAATVYIDLFQKGHPLVGFDALIHLSHSK